MRARLGRFSGTKTTVWCTKSEACLICGRCRNYDRTQVLCRNCYSWREFANNCYRHLLGQDPDAGVRYVNEQLDKKMFDPDEQGEVQFHRDPYEDVRELIEGKTARRLPDER